MRTMNFLIGLISLVAFWVIAACLEDKLILQVGKILEFLAGTFALTALLGALWRAPEGYEDADGFHIGSRHRQTEHVRRAEPGQRRPTLKMDMTRLFSSS